MKNHQKSSLKQENLLHETIKYYKIFHETRVSKGTLFDIGINQNLGGK